MLNHIPVAAVQIAIAYKLIKRFDPERAERIKGQTKAIYKTAKRIIIAVARGTRRALRVAQPFAQAKIIKRRGGYYFTAHVTLTVPWSLIAKHLVRYGAFDPDVVNDQIDMPETQREIIELIYSNKALSSSLLIEYGSPENLDEKAAEYVNKIMGDDDYYVELFNIKMPFMPKDKSYGIVITFNVIYRILKIQDVDRQMESMSIKAMIDTYILEHA
jgi:hypothetical protein